MIRPLVESRLLSLTATLALLGGLAACERPAPEPEVDVAPPPEAHIVDVTALDYVFQAPAEIPSGWTTFRMTNAGEQEHFLVLWPLPAGRTFDDYKEEILASFETLSHAYQAGEIDRDGLMKGLGEQLPQWAGEFFQAAGGPGLTAPGRVAETAVHLEPGTYIMECYVRAPEGQYHSMLGMVRPLVVTDEPSGAPEPRASVDLTISNYRIDMVGELRTGRQTIGVHIAEAPEGFLPHDLHLARLEPGTDVEQVIAWTDWVDELTAPAPAEFLGGAEQMAPGRTGYFTVDLEPGRYVLVSKEYSAQGVVKELTIE